LGLQQLIKRVKAEIPARRASGDPPLSLLESGGPSADPVDPSVALAVDKPRLLEHTKMSRDGRNEIRNGLANAVIELSPQFERRAGIWRRVGSTKAAKMAAIFP